MKKRNYCFTLNNYTEEEVHNITLSPDIKYICWGFERGALGTPHMQGYVELRKACRINAVKRILNCDRVHLEARLGNQKQAIDYCKKDGDFHEHGTPARQGHRSDLEAVAKSIKKGNSLFDIVNDHTVQYIKYHKGIEKAMNILIEAPTWRDVEVHVLWGNAGAGKTRYVYDNEDADEIYSLGKSNNAVWFDGYCRHKVLLIDDFYGWIQYSKLLNILDGHPLRLEIKGSFAMAHYTKVYITSNTSPEGWYTHGMTPALERRITTVQHFE